MRLLISQYLRLLKERDELDALIPDLLQAMGLTPISRAQTGVRQKGVDIAAVGPDPHSGENKLFLIVVKRGDIGRTDWDTGPQSIRSSLEEIFDVYLQNNLHPQYRDLPVCIWVCTSGDLLQTVNESFTGYSKNKQTQAEILFCGADKLSEWIEEHLLNENIFLGEDRKLLRKALVLVGDSEYDLNDYYRLLLSQLKISQEGVVTEQNETSFLGCLTRIHLALNVIIAWGSDAHNLKQPLNAAERTLLWAWHAMLKNEFIEKSPVWEKYAAIYATYLRVALLYIKKTSPYFIAEDGMGIVSNDSALISVSIFRQISILASVGISAASLVRITKDPERLETQIKDISYLLKSIIICNRASSSPRLDENCIDINLAMILFILVGDTDFVQNWLSDLIAKLFFSTHKRKFYPVSSDNLEEVAQIEHGNCEGDKLMLEASWLIPSLITWCALLDMDVEYNKIVQDIIIPNPEIAPQLWHPVAETYEKFYFGYGALSKGETEIIDFSDKISTAKTNIIKFRSIERYNLFNFSPAVQRGFLGLELLACKHFRIPVPSTYIYSWLVADASENSLAEEQ